MKNDDAKANATAKAAIIKTHPTYSHLALEKKWQKKWASAKLYKSTEKKLAATAATGHKKFYVLDMFPYPSGEGLHVGHPKGYIATDVVSRMKRMQGHSVLHPMGFDAFGLPAENYAIKTKTNPAVSVGQNVARYKKQLEILGLDYDWSREINTTDPAYYRWTQWIFLKLFKRGLAYESNEPINWCPSCKTGLANEDVEDGKCERCGTVVEKKPLRQWVLRITDYAERLLSDLDLPDLAADPSGKTPFLDWPSSIKELQRNWIGKSQGVNFKCRIKDLGIEVEMYNSVPQTYRAETFTVIAPEHPLVERLVKGTKHEKAVMDFVAKIKAKKAGNAFDVDKDMEGIFTGRYIESYADTGRDLPIWVASYVVADYGTGMVNCSAHDTRDFAFAKKYNIPLHEVAEPLVRAVKGEDAVHADLPMVERDAVVVVIKHWAEDKYLCLKWKAVKWQGFVVGGIENGENPEAAAIREATEETGYKNMKVVRTLGGKVHAQFYHVVKKQNRFAHFTPVLVQLTDGERAEMSEEEKALHDVLWLSPKEVDGFVDHGDMEIIWSRAKGEEKAIVKNGILLEPTEFKGREWAEVRPDIIKYLGKHKIATPKTNYKLRDWVFSRQRYWGEPIPLIHCEKCGVVPVPEKDLPVKLPPVKSYEPTGTGESPLAAISKWVNVKCPNYKRCGNKKARRETNTMPQWAGSSWYYLRYMDPKNKKQFASAAAEKFWAPVDLYVGGAEHATRHLIYARFWHKVLFDAGLVSTTEPFRKLQHVGLIMGPDGRKMSKRFGNVINPDEIVATFGADTLRLYEMFMGPFDQAIAWNTDSMVGSRRFIERVWKMAHEIVAAEKTAKKTKQAEQEAPATAALIALHKAIKKVTEDIGAMRFNTAVSELMICLNAFEKENAATITSADFSKFLALLAPFTPHVAEELWALLGNKKSIHIAPWPTFDPALLKSNSITYAVQINGKVRGECIVPADISDGEVEAAARTLPEIAKWLEGKTVKKVIVIKGRLISFVVA